MEYGDVMTPETEVIDTLDEVVGVVQQVGENHHHTAASHPPRELMQNLGNCSAWLWFDVFQLSRDVSQYAQRAFGFNVLLQFPVKNSHTR